MVTTNDNADLVAAIEYLQSIVSVEDTTTKNTTFKSGEVELIEMLNGCEIYSINYDGAVGVRGTDVVRDGEVIDSLDTADKIADLWAEYTEAELC